MAELASWLERGPEAADVTQLELQNQYLQVTIPIAAELKLMGDQKLQVNIAAGLQPSYLGPPQSPYLTNGAPAINGAQ